MYGTFNSIEQKLIQILEKYTANDLPMPDAYDAKLPHTPPMQGNKQDKVVAQDMPIRELVELKNNDTCFQLVPS